MEAKKTSPGNGDRREGSYYSRARGRTISGAVPDAQDDNLTPLEAMRLLWGSPSSPESPTTAHRPSTSPKSGSGSKRHSGGLLSRFKSSRDNKGESPLSKELRPGSRGKEKETGSPTKATFDVKGAEDDASATLPTEPEREIEAEGNGEAVSSAVKQTNKTRKRRGSLRKTAMLGTRRMVSEERERNGDLTPLHTNTLALKQAQRATSRDDQSEEAVVVDDEHTSPVERLGGEFERNSSSAPAVYLDSPPQSPERQSSSFEVSSISTGSTSSDIIWPEPAAVSATRLALLTDHRSGEGGRRRPGTSSTLTDDLDRALDAQSSTSQASFISATTTSDDDVMTLNSTFTGKSTSTTNSTHLLPPLSSTSTSYFPTLSLSIPHPRTSKRLSPLSRTVTSQPPAPTDPHDYTTTESWGWIILLTTWLTFTVGMGSCLDLWSWAWDVGETPYAPPELEDDPTLPIVGYYPALLVLTGVVAWVWITLAWVGMKYFRHAKIEV